MCFLFKNICILFILCCITHSYSLPFQSDTLSAELQSHELSSESSSTTIPSINSNNQITKKPEEISAAGAAQSSLPTITYDQRQDGKYNVRADLENFLLLVIPSTPTASESIFDLLMKSNLMRRNLKLAKRKKLRLQNKTQAQQLSAKRNENSYPISSQQQDHQFIEGRTPYHVDISDTKVLSAIGNKIVPQNIIVPKLLNSENLSKEGNPIFNVMENYHRRNGKAIVSSNLNSVISNSVANQDNNVDEFTTNNNNEWRDVNDADNSFDRLNIDNVDQFAANGGRDGISGNSDDGWDLTLLGAHEQCGPDRVRDSYGVCQFILPDFK